MSLWGNPVATVRIADRDLAIRLIGYEPEPRRPSPRDIAVLTPSANIFGWDEIRAWPLLPRAPVK